MRFNLQWNSYWCDSIYREILFDVIQFTVEAIWCDSIYSGKLIDVIQFTVEFLLMQWKANCSDSIYSGKRLGAIFSFILDSIHSGIRINAIFSFILVKLELKWFNLQWNFNCWDFLFVF